MAWWTLQNIVVAGLIATIVQAVCRVTRAGPASRHALWLVVLIKLLTPPLFVIESPLTMPAEIIVPDALSSAKESIAPTAPDRIDDRRSVKSSTATATLARQPRSVAFTQTPRVAARAGSTARTLERSTWISRWPIVWIAGSLFFIAIQLIRIFRVACALRAGKPPDETLAADVAALVQRLDIATIQIRVVRGINSPLIWCLHPRRPQLLWPDDMTRFVSEDRRAGLIVHELAHLKRGDHWVGWLELAAGCLWWWNPIFWYVRSQLRLNAELAGDAWVVEILPQQRRTYAEALVALCAGRAPFASPIPAMGIGTGRTRMLERRLVVIMRDRGPVRVSRVAFFGVAVLLALMLPAWALRVVNPPRVTAPLFAMPLAIAPASAPMVPSAHVTANEQPPAPVVPELDRVMEQFARQQAEIRRDVEARLARHREQLLQQLRALEQSYASAGQTDRARAVRTRIDDVQREAPALTVARSSGRTPLRGETFTVESGSFVRFEATPVGLGQFRGRVGTTLTLPVVGSRDGHVWGDGIYTDDSSLAAAAVHAGVVSPGEFGFVRVTILPGQDWYEGTTSYGVTSDSYGKWHGSYRLNAAAPPFVVRLPDDVDPLRVVSLSSLRGQIGVSFSIEVTGSRRGNVWGTDIYTDDSSIAAAAVHAGVLSEGERGVVLVTILPGMPSYFGSARNGIETMSYGAWEGSFRIERAPAR